MKSGPPAFTAEKSYTSSSLTDKLSYSFAQINEFAVIRERLVGANPRVAVNGHGGPSKDG